MLADNLPIEQQCMGCGACIDICKHHAIMFSESENGFYVPHIDSKQCVECGLCSHICPILNPNKIIRNDASRAKIFAGWSLEENIRYSASGGIFYQVAKQFLSTPGSWIVGAVLQENTTVKHIIISDPNQLRLLQNSKYQQSDTSGIYRAVKQKLKTGDRVLFSGTPCQVAALYAQDKHLHDNKNLYTMEVVCHGVPSNYLAQVAKKIYGADRIVAYRTKSKGWEKGNRIVYGIGNHVEEVPRYRKDFHVRAYLSLTWLRTACSKCPYATIHRVADITMGDFWGYPKYLPQNKMGVSVVLANNSRGEQLLATTSALHLQPAKWEDALKLNQNLYMPTIQGGKGATYIQNIRQLPLRLQKWILQHGFTNKWLFGIGQVIESLCHIRSNYLQRNQRMMYQKEALKIIADYPQKVGILTTYFAANFGAMLQPYALMRVLERAGFTVSLIRYKQQAVYAAHKPFRWEIIRNKAWGTLFSLPFAIVQDNRMQSFKRKYLKVNNRFDNQVPVDFDYYIFGSDQIWNPKNTQGFDKIYFGNFQTKVGAKKIAYAASGECIEDTNDNRNFLRENLYRFDAIAVRERLLQQKLVAMTGINDIDVVLDPTLLATKDILDELPGRDVMEGKKYVLFYHVRQCVPFLNQIHKFARNHGAELLIISSTPKKDYMLYAMKHKDVVYLPSAGMEEFLGGIRGASYVFTPSFHGNAFAVIYEKPLFSIALGDGLDTRAQDLLVQLGMKERIIGLLDDWDSLPATDYIPVRAKLEQLRKHSMDYLFSHLKQ